MEKPRTTSNTPETLVERAVFQWGAVSIPTESSRGTAHATVAAILDEQRREAAWQQLGDILQQTGSLSSLWRLAYDPYGTEGEKGVLAYSYATPLLQNETTEAKKGGIPAVWLLRRIATHPRYASLGLGNLLLRSWMEWSKRNSVVLVLENAASPPRSLQEEARQARDETSSTNEEVAILRKRYQEWYHRHGWVELCAHGKKGIPVLVYNVPPHATALAYLRQVLCGM
ncbi:MAG: hypothetical protein KatS3mg099_041 [Candidatus Parcubacteria bacterium]|nr:MAG: hypothetical protein KatS3mg099_041 [Candidatus Parcubacteria bacterium]